MTGKMLAHYEVLELLGKGGMGEVYRARDTKLDRDVALKILPEELAADPERLARLEREAKLLASLNHPHIATIHSLEEDDGLRFLVLELVEGESLQQQLARGPVPIERTLEIGRQVAEALEAAHAAGIVHRDLKPANVLVTADERAKVLDFGIAKSITVDADVAATAQDTNLTVAGTLVGTPSYMSPEQVRGEAIDKRADIWAFGCLLYELLSGRRAFGRETLADTLAAIVEQEPNWKRLPPLHPRIRMLLERCLEKRPRNRYHDIAEARVDIEVAMADPHGLSVMGATFGHSEQRRSGTALRVAAGAALALALGAVAYLFFSADESLPLFTNPVRVTSAGGLETRPSWSPDGGRIAFESEASGNGDIWVAQLGGGPPMNRTADHTGGDRFPAWSPEGGTIAFASQRGGRLATWVMSAVGGAVRKVHDPDDLVFLQDASWSADGSRLAVSFWNAEGMAIDIVSVATLETERIELPRFCADMSWSSDRSAFACVDAGQPNWAVSRPWLHYPGRDPILLLDDGSRSREPTWSRDGRSILFVSNRGGSMDLWRQRLGPDGLPRGEPEELTTGRNLRSFAFSSDGRKIAYSRGRTVGNVWRVPILTDRPATWADAERITSDQAYIRRLDVTPDGRYLIVDSDREGRHHLWIMPAAGGEMRQLTAGLAPDLNPSVSPDGNHIAFYSWKNGNRDLFVMPFEGGVARPLAPHPAHDMSPAWSPDGSEIAFTSLRSGGSDIWIVAADGDSEPRQLTDHPALDQGPNWYGSSVVFESWRGPSASLWQMPAEGGEAKPLTAAYLGRSRVWSSDGETMYFVGGVPPTIWARSMDTGVETPAATFEGRPGSLATDTIDTDGTYIYFNWLENEGDIWVMDVAEGIF